MSPFKATSRLRVSDRKGKWFLRVECPPGHFDRYAYGDWLGKLAERKHVKHNLHDGYLVPINDASAVAMAEWGSRLVFEDDLAKSTYQKLLLLSMKQEINAKRTLAMRAELKRWADVVREGGEYICQVESTPDTYMTLHQRVSYDNASGTDGHAFFEEQGTGKTLPVVRRILKEARDKADDLYRAVVVCPNNVRQNWVRELWAFNGDMEIVGDAVVLDGDEIKRVGTLTRAMRNRPGKRFSLVVVSYDTMVVAWNTLQLVQWDLAVLDESHYIKNDRAKRTKTSLKLRDNALARMCLSGTPVTNSINDLYSQFEFLGEGYSGFSDGKKFKAFYNKTVKLPDGTEKLVELQKIPVLKERLGRLSTIVRKHEALPFLPPKVFDIVSVDLGPEQAKLYKQVGSELAVEIAEDLENSTGPKQLVVKNILTKLLRLAQITSGYISWDGIYSDEGEELQPRRVERIQPNPKAQAIVDQIKATDEPTRKWMIWACWTENIVQLAELVEAEGYEVVTYYGDTPDKEREEAERRFNTDDTCRVFIGNPAAGGAGLTLLGYDPKAENPSEMNCDQVYYYSMSWSMVHRAQSEDRPHRRGTRVPVRVSDFLCLGTIDEQISSRVMQKRKDALDIQEVQEILALLAEVVL